MKKRSAFLHTLNLTPSPLVQHLRSTQLLSLVDLQSIHSLKKEAFLALWHTLCLPVIADKEHNHYQHLTSNRRFELLRHHPLAHKEKIQLHIYSPEEAQVVQPTLLLLEPALLHHDHLSLGQLRKSHQSVNSQLKSMSSPCTISFNDIQQLYKA